MVALVFALVTGFIFMCLMRCLAGCIIWFALFSIVFLFLGLGLIFLYQSGNYFGGADGAASYMGIPDSGSPHSEVYGWICISFSIIFLIIILCCCSRIRLAVAVCKCAAQFVGSVCLVLLVPLFQAVLAILLWVTAIIVMVYLISAAKFTANSGDYVSGVADYEDQALVRFYFFILLTFWVNAFIGAMTIFVIASATVMWYYSHGPGQELELPIARSYKMVFRFYIGSLAFGALLVAIIQFLQMIVELFKKKAEAEAGDNCCIKCVACFISCCLACVECIVKFINTQAYIQIAIRGKNFCYAAKDGFELAWANAARFAIVGGVGTVIGFIGKLAIACTTATCFYLMITQTSLKDNYLQPTYQVLVILPPFSWPSSSAGRSACSSCPSTPWPWTPFFSASSSTRPTPRARARRSQPSPPKN